MISLHAQIKSTSLLVNDDEWKKEIVRLDSKEGDESRKETENRGTADSRRVESGAGGSKGFLEGSEEMEGFWQQSRQITDFSIVFNIKLNSLM